VAEPTSILVDTFGTGRIEDSQITKLVRKHFELKPAGLVKMLDLLKPVYLPTASYGHFGRKEFSWEKTDRADALRADAKIK
jgi:S-adenosylmethionine synthetase